MLAASLMVAAPATSSVIQVMLTRIGEVFTLPSGRAVRVNYAADSRRPWHVVGRRSDARVCRAHSNPAARGVEFYSEHGADVAMIFDEYDAKALAYILNTARRAWFHGKRPHPTKAARASRAGSAKGAQTKPGTD